MNTVRCVECLLGVWPGLGQGMETWVRCGPCPQGFHWGVEGERRGKEAQERCMFIYLIKYLFFWLHREACGI